MRSWAFRTLFVVGALVGLWHMKLALEAVFVFRSGEPLASWCTIALGPGFTLPGVLIAGVRPKWGGVALIVAAVLAVAIFAGAPDSTDAVPRFLQLFTLPSILLGAAFIALARYRGGAVTRAP